MLSPKLCAVHRLYEFLKKDTVNTLAARTQSPEFKLMQYIDVSRLNRIMKDVALAVGDPRAMSAETHGPRRGYACDLALAGAPLSKILEEGDWRSESFRLYLESIRDQLQNRALMGILGCPPTGFILRLSFSPDTRLGRDLLRCFPRCALKWRRK